jgi:hypothetical protein
MCEKPKEALIGQFDKRLRLEFQGASITSDGGLPADRRLDGALELTEVGPTCLRETRGSRNVQHEIAPLLRQSGYRRSARYLAGYEDTNDALRLVGGPARQAAVGHRSLEKQAASTKTLSRAETEALVTEENLRGLEQLNAEWVDRAMMRTRHQRIILDRNSSESPVYGEQEGTACRAVILSVSATTTCSVSSDICLFDWQMEA